MSAFEALTLAADLLAIAIALSAIWFANHRFRERARKDDVERLYDMVLEHAHRVTEMRDRLNTAPSDQAMRDLGAALASQTGELKLMVERLRALEKAADKVERAAAIVEGLSRGRST